MARRLLKLAAVVALAGAGLAGCASQVALSPDYGWSLNQNMKAQVADPDAKYAGSVVPAADGHRTSLAQTRYQKNQVPQPSVSTTTGIRQSGGGGGNGGNGGGASGG